jgi:hypothetical protein
MDYSDSVVALVRAVRGLAIAVNVIAAILWLTNAVVAAPLVNAALIVPPSLAVLALLRSSRLIWMLATVVNGALAVVGTFATMLSSGPSSASTLFYWSLFYAPAMSASLALLIPEPEKKSEAEGSVSGS